MGDDPFHLVLIGFDGADDRSENKFPSHFFTCTGQTLGKQSGVSGFITGNKNASRNAMADFFQAGVDFRSTIRIDDFQRQPVFFQDFHIGRSFFQTFLVSVQVKQSSGSLFVSDPGFLNHLLKNLLGIKTKPVFGQGICSGCRVIALAEKTQSPVKQLEVWGESHAEGLVLTVKRFQQNLERFGRGPGKGMPGSNQTGIAETCAALSRQSTVDDRHIVSIFEQVPGGTNSDDSCS